MVTMRAVPVKKPFMPVGKNGLQLEVENWSLVTKNPMTITATVSMTRPITNCAMAPTMMDLDDSRYTPTATQMPMMTSWVCDMSGHQRYCTIWMAVIVRKPSTER